MSHTTTIGIKTDLEHIEFAREGYANVAESIKKDLAVTRAAQTKLALTALMEYAEAGARLAEQTKEIIRNSAIAESSSH